MLHRAIVTPISIPIHAMARRGPNPSAAITLAFIASESHHPCKLITSPPSTPHLHLASATAASVRSIGGCPIITAGT